MRLALDTLIQSYVDEGLITAVLFVGEVEQIQLGEGAIYSDGPIPVEVPIWITSIKTCALADLTSDEVRATGNINHRGLIEALEDEGEPVTEKTTVTLVAFQREPC